MLWVNHNKTRRYYFEPVLHDLLPVSTSGEIPLDSFGVLPAFRFSLNFSKMDLLPSLRIILFILPSLKPESLSYFIRHSNLYQCVI